MLSALKSRCCYFSVSAGTFNDLLHQTCPLTIHNNNIQSEQVSAEEQLAVALHFLTALIFTLLYTEQSGHWLVFTYFCGFLHQTLWQYFQPYSIHELLLDRWSTLYNTQVCKLKLMESESCLDIFWAYCGIERTCNPQQFHSFLSSFMLPAPINFPSISSLLTSSKYVAVIIYQKYDVSWLHKGSNKHWLLLPVSLLITPLYPPFLLLWTLSALLPSHFIFHHCLCYNLHCIYNFQASSHPLMSVLSSFLSCPVSFVCNWCR